MLLHVCLEGRETGHSIGLSFVHVVWTSCAPSQYHATRRALHLCGNLQTHNSKSNHEKTSDKPIFEGCSTTP